MGALHVRDIPDDILVWLRERAERNGRSASAELRQILARVKAGDEAK